MRLRRFMFFLFIVVILSCGSKNNYVLLQVGPQKLTSHVFKKRFVRSKKFNQNTEFTKTRIKDLLKEIDVNEMLYEAEGYDLNLHKDREIQQKLEFEKKKRLTSSKGPLFKALVPDTFLVTDAEIRAYYEDSKREIRVAHILLDSKSLADSLSRLLAQGASFAELAARFSTDTATAADGGVIEPYFSRGRMTMDFDSVAFDLAKGEISEPVETIYGFHIIRLLDSRKRQPAPAPLNEIKEKLRKRLATTKREEYIQKALHRMHQKYELTVTEAYFDEIASAYREEMGKKKILKDEIDPELLEQPFIQWQGGGWSVGEFVLEYNARPIYTKSTLKGRKNIKEFCIRMATPELMYQEALRRGLDQSEPYRQEIQLVRDRLVREACKEKLIYSRIVLTDKEMEIYYQENSEKFEYFSKERSMTLIKNQLVSNKAKALENEVLSDLRAKYNVRFYDRNIKRMAKQLTRLKKS